MDSNIKYIVSYRSMFTWYGEHNEKHLCYDSREDAIEMFKQLGGYIDNKTYNCSFGGCNDEDPEIDIFISRIMITVDGRSVSSELLRIDDEKRPSYEAINRACTYECPNYHHCPYSHINEKADCKRVIQAEQDYFNDLQDFFD